MENPQELETLLRNKFLERIKKQFYLEVQMSELFSNDNILNVNVNSQNEAIEKYKALAIVVL